MASPLHLENAIYWTNYDNRNSNQINANKSGSTPCDRCGEHKRGVKAVMMRALHTQHYNNSNKLCLKCRNHYGSLVVAVARH